MGVGFAIFYLRKIDVVFCGGDDIDFVKFGFVIAGEDGVAFWFEIVGNGLLGVGACVSFVRQASRRNYFWGTGHSARRYGRAPYPSLPSSRKIPRSSYRRLAF